MSHKILQIYTRISTAPQFLRNLIKLTVDLIIILASICFSFLLRFDWVIPAEYIGDIWFLFIGFGLPSVLLFHVLGAYSEMWVYWSFRDLKRLLGIHTLVVIVLSTSNVFFGFLSLPRSIYVLYYINSICLLTLFRLSARIIMALTFSNSATQKKVLIVGAGRSGEMIVRQILENRDVVEYQIVGLVDDDPRKIGHTIHGVKVLGSVDRLDSIIKEKEVDEIIIAMPSATSIEMRRIIKTCEETRVQFRTIPGPKELVDGHVHYNQIRKVWIEDLLGREESKVDEERIESLIQGKRIMVTGAAGSIGSELCRQILSFEPELLIAIDKDENKMFYLNQEFDAPSWFKPIVMQLQNERKLDHIFRLYKPTLVFHAAAYKHVPSMEYFQDEAILNNVETTRIIARLALEYDVEKFVQISTDKAVCPTNMMGVSKRICELYIQHMTTKRDGFISVRFGNVIGSQGSVFTVFEEQIKKRQPLTVTHPEMKRYFMSIREACRLTMEAALQGKGGCIFILDMGYEVSIVELAEQMIRLSGLKPYEDIPINFTGLRPGEKLREKLWYDYEKPEKTIHEKIFVTKTCDLGLNNFEKNIARILKLARELKTDAMLEKIKKIVPEFEYSSPEIKDGFES